MIQKLKDVTYKVGLKINFEKTESVDNMEVHTVQSYIYLNYEVKFGRDNQTAELSYGIW